MVNKVDSRMRAYKPSGPHASLSSPCQLQGLARVAPLPPQLRGNKLAHSTFAALLVLLAMLPTMLCLDCEGSGMCSLGHTKQFIGGCTAPPQWGGERHTVLASSHRA